MDEIPDTVNQFWIEFNKAIEKIKVEINETSSRPVSIDNRQDKNLRNQIAEAQKYATANTALLPAYDIRRTQEILDILLQELKRKEEMLLPKKKFTFSKKNNSQDDKKLCKEDNKSSTEVVGSIRIDIKDANVKEMEKLGEKPKIELLPGSYIFNECDEKTITTTSNELMMHTLSEVPSSSQPSVGPLQLLFKNCKHSKFTISGVLGSVRIEHVHHCEIFLSPCSASVYLESVKDCTIVIACHQLRIHQSSDCNLFVRVNSHPIIENCVRMGFSPHDSIQELVYDNIDEDMKNAGLLNSSCWDNVVDFKWHKSEKSPNWFILNEEQRLDAMQKLKINT